MRNAPPAEAACAIGGWWLHTRQLLHAAAAAAVVAWAAAHAGAPDAAVLAGAAAAGAIGGWLVRASPPAASRLSWDGRQWALDAGDGSPPVAGAAAPLFDFGGALLVVFVPGHGGGRRWLAFDDAGDASAPLRAALYAARPATSDAPAAAPRIG